MRKVDPEDVRNAFIREIEELVTYFDRVSHRLDGTPHEKRDVSELAKTVFLAACVAFERFLSDLFLAYMNRDFSAYQRHLCGRIETITGKRYGEWAKRRVKFDEAKHVSVSELEEIVDGSGRNLTFYNAGQLKRSARNWLAAPHRRLLQLTGDDERLFDTAKAIRNFLAHQSRASKDHMDHQLAIVDDGGPNVGLGRGVKKVNEVGAFLKAQHEGKRRVVRYLKRLSDLARKM